MANATEFKWIGGAGATSQTLGQSGNIPPSKELTMPRQKTVVKQDPKSGAIVQQEFDVTGKKTLEVTGGKVTGGDTESILAWKAQQQLLQKKLDPRFQTTLVMPQAKKEEISPAPPMLQRLWKRFQAMQKENSSAGKFAIQKFKAPLGDFFDARIEDVKIGLGNTIKEAFGVQRTGEGEEEILAQQLSAAGMQREARALMEEVQQRRIDDMTEREITDKFDPPGLGEKVTRSITQGVASVAPAMVVARGAGVKRLAGKAMRNLIAEEAVESLSFASMKFDFENTPIEQLPQDFWNDFKYAFPFATGVKVIGSPIVDSFKNLMTAAQKQGVELSPAVLKNGLSGNPRDDFSRAWAVISAEDQRVLNEAWQQQRLFGEARPVFLKDPNLTPGRPGIEQPALPPAPRQIPRGDVPQVFRTDKLNLDEKELTRVMAHFEALGLETRGVQTFDQVKELADELGTDPVALINGIKNNQLQSQDVLALRDTINGSARYLSNANTLLDEAITPAQKEAVQARITQHEQLMDRAINSLVKGGTQAGRTVSAYRLIARNTLDPAFWLKEVRRVSGEKTIDNWDEISIAVNDLIRKKDQLGLAHFVAKFRESDNIEKAMTLWKAGLLTSPTTFEANFLGNTTMQALETAKDIPATIIDWAISSNARIGFGKFSIPLGTGKRTKAMTFQGFVEQSKGLMAGGKKAIDYFRTGIDADHSLTKYDIPRTVNFNNAYLQTYTDFVFRSLGATDKIFREGIVRKSLYEQAVVKVKNLLPAELKKISDDLASEYGESVSRKDIAEFFFKNADDTMVKQAIDDAEYATFLQPNSLAADITRAKHTGSAPKRITVEVLVPFAKTPANVAMTIADYSPIGFLKAVSKGLKGNQKGFVESFSRGITGTAVMALGAQLAKDGLMTASLPTTAKERELWKMNGIQQQSIFYDGKWRRLDRMSPLGNLLATGAEFNRFGRDRTLVDRYSATAFGGLKGLTEQSFLQGVSQGLKAVNDPKRYAQAFIENSISGVVPSLIGRVAQGLDTVQRDDDTLLQVLQSRIPILAESLPAKKDAFGRNIPNRSGFWGRIFDPFSSSAATGDPVAGELFKLNEPVSIPAKGLYNEQEYRDLLEMRGKMLYPLLYGIMSEQNYQKTMNDDQRRYIIKSISDYTTENANAFMRQKAALRLAKELAAMSPEDRDIRYKEIKDRDQKLSLYIQNLYSTQPEYDR